MPRGGNNRKTRRAKVVQGTFRRDRDRSGLPASPGIPTPPRELTGKARKKWDELVARPGLQQVLSPHDGEALAALCMHWAVMLTAFEKIAKDGPLVKGYRGALVKHPALQVLRDSSSALGGYLARFGLTPVDRARVAMLEVDDADEFEEFLQREKEHNAGVARLVQRENEVTRT